MNSIKQSDNDTIVAISTALGEGGIGILRLSGSQAIAIADKVFKSKSGLAVRDQKTFTAQYGHVISGSSGKSKKIIDEVILLLMRAPKSYTCQDVVEISAHGGSVSQKAVLELLIAHGARLAEPGEFTKRAFLNGRIDLLQAEAVLDLIQAKTELGRQWAASQLEGVFSKKAQGFKEELVVILAHLEASIDFPEDETDPDAPSAMASKIQKIMDAIQKLLEGSELGFIAKRGLKVVLVGKPNVGKSSLMNCLSKKNRVIVTEYPGTTRDVVEEMIEIKGFPVILSDTAGIRPTDHPIEKEGVERSKQAVAAADLVLFVLDRSQAVTAEDQALLHLIQPKKKILVLNKSDLSPKLEELSMKALAPEASIISCSCVKNDGVSKLEDEIFRFITDGKQEISEEFVISSVRQKDLMQKALASLKEAKQACQNKLSPEFCAADVKAALNHLGELVGEVVNDEVLELLFNRFCIGK